MVVAGDAGHDGPLVRHGGAAEVYKQVSQHTGQLLERREGGKHRENLELKKLKLTRSPVQKWRVIKN